MTAEHDAAHDTAHAAHDIAPADTTHAAADATAYAPDVAPCGLYAVIALAGVVLVALVVLCQVARALNQFEPTAVDNALTRFTALTVLVIFVAQSLLVDALVRDICCDHNHWRRAGARW